MDAVIAAHAAGTMPASAGVTVSVRIPRHVTGRARGVPLFITTGLVIGATVALLTDAPLLPTTLGITAVGTLFGWLRTGWRWPHRRHGRRSDAAHGTAAPPSARALAFLSLHGRDVIEGHIQGGLPPDRALELIAMLEDEGTPVYGLEVWRFQHGGYDMDPTSLWYADDRYGASHEDARAGLRQSNPAPLDLVLIQFGAPPP